MASHPNTTECKKFWADFLLMYRKLPALWKIKSPDYRDRKMKKRCYDLLVQKLREIDPNADRQMVVKKINTFRGNFRREHKKILKTQHADEPYISNLWYYELLEFLYGELRCRTSPRGHGDKDYDYDEDDCEEDELHLMSDGDERYDDDDENFAAFCDDETQQTGCEQQQQQMRHVDGTLTDIECVLINSDNLEELEYLQSGDMKPTLSELQAERAQNYQQSATKKRRLELTSCTKKENKTNVDDDDAIDGGDSSDVRPQHFSRQHASSALAQSWESQYNEMSSRQKILARKMISDILYFGCLGQLNEWQPARLQKLFQLYPTQN